MDLVTIQQAVQSDFILNLGEQLQVFLARMAAECGIHLLERFAASLEAG
jgi:hypothetical protein